MNRGRLIAAVASAAVLVGAVTLLRSGVQAPGTSAVGPDGQRITAYHDPALVDPPQQPRDRPQRPDPVRVDPRRGGALLSWPPAPYGFEVRWRPAGAKQSETRYVATRSTSLHGLRPGRYQVEVRSVNEIGRRSDPGTAEFEVSDQAPAWQHGLAFVEDFTAGADLPPDRWLMSERMRQCTRREGADGPILLGRDCETFLRPVSPLMLAEPDTAEIRGRVVVLADTPPPLSGPQRPPTRDPAPEPPPAESSEWTDWSSELVIGVSPAPTQYAPDGIRLRIRPHAAFLELEAGRAEQPMVEHRLNVPRTGSPGALHRWELLFASDRVLVHLDGEQIGSAVYRAPSRQAYVSVYASMPPDRPNRTGIRVGLVGLTGPAPDGRATELVEVWSPGDGSAEHRFPLPAAPTVESVLLVAQATTPAVPGTLPQIIAEVGGQPVQLHSGSFNGSMAPSAWFTADVPARLLQSTTAVVLRSVDGADFVAYGLELQLKHRPGIGLGRPSARPQPRAAPSVASPALVVRYDRQVIGSGQPQAPGVLDVEVRLNVVADQAAAGELAGYVALRVELDGRRVLDFPTVVDGPAVAGSYRFTIDTRELPPGSRQTLVVTLVPDRPGVTVAADRFDVRVTD